MPSAPVPSTARGVAPRLHARGAKPATRPRATTVREPRSRSSVGCPSVAGELASTASGSNAAPAATACSEEGVRGTRTTAAASAAATRSGQPPRSDHHAPTGLTSSARPTPVRSSTSQDTAPRVPRPYAATGTSRRSATRSATSTGAARAEPTAGSWADQALVEVSTSAPRTATDSAPRSRLTGCERAQSPTSRPSAVSAPPTSAPVPRQSRASSPARPADRAPSRSSVSMPRHDQPERLRSAAQTTPGEQHGGGREQGGHTGEHQGAPGEAEQAPGDGHEDDGRDQQAQRTERQQHHRHRRRGQPLGPRRRGPGGEPGERGPEVDRRRGRLGRGDRCTHGHQPQTLDDPVSRLHHPPELTGERPLQTQPAARAGAGRVQRLPAVRADGGVEESAHAPMVLLGRTRSAPVRRLNLPE